MQSHSLNGNPDITWDYSALQDTLYIRLRQDFDASFYDELADAPGVLLRYSLDETESFVGITAEHVTRRLKSAHPPHAALCQLAADLVARFAPTA